MTREQLTSATTAWMRADLMLGLFEHYKGKRIEESGYVVPRSTIIKDNDGICLFLWHALIFAVIEFLKQNNSIPESISAEVEIFYYPLKEFRNCTFHIQDQFLSERCYQLMDIDNAFERVHNIHSVIGKFLEAGIKSLPPIEKRIS